MSDKPSAPARRRFLRGAGSGVLALSTGLASGCKVLVAPDAEAVAVELRALLYRELLVAELGRAWLGPDSGASLDRLTETLLDSLGIRLDRTLLLPVGDLLEALAARIRDDFAAGRVASVAGWLLAEAEARTCAIAYLSRRGEGRA